MARKSTGKTIFSIVMFAILISLAIRYQNKQQEKAKAQVREERERVAKEAPLAEKRLAAERGARAERAKQVGRIEKADGQAVSASTAMPAERGSDPDYPTPALAGTAGIFLLEEPDRGPLVTEVDLPEPKKLRWTWHAACELAGATVACGPRLSRKAKSSLHFAKGMRAGKLHMVERRKPGGRVDLRWVLKYGSDGKLQQLAELGAGDRLRWVRSFGAGGLSYRSRGLDGANTLDGCGSMQLELDKGGRAVRVQCMQWNGQRMLDAHGVAATALVRDGQGMELERRFLDVQGAPVTDRYGVHSERITRDPAGRELKRFYFGLDGKPVLSKRKGCHGWEMRYGADGVQTLERCLGLDGQVLSRPQGYAAEEYISDRRGCMVEKRYLDAAGKASADNFGVAKTLVHVDDHCRVLRASCLDMQGQAHACRPKGPAEVRYRLDDKGRVISATHHGKDGGPAGDSTYLVYELRKQWDDQDRLVRVSCFAPKGKARDCGSTGFHAIVRRYDDAGRVVEARFEDAQGKSTTNLGTSRRVFVYDNYDHQVYSTNRDAQDRLVDSMGMTTQHRLYDQGHRLFAVLLEDAQGKPARYRGCFTGAECPKGDWHAVRVMRGERGGAVKNLFFDADGQKVMEHGCAKHLCWK